MPNRLTTTTNNKLLPKVVDSVLDSNVLFTRQVVKAAKWRGEKIQKSVKVVKNTLGGSFDGLDTFSTAQTDTRRKLEFEAKFQEIPVTLALTELSKNRADKNLAMVDLAAIELESAAEDMADDLGTLFYLDGTGNGSKDILGLGAIVDDGTNAATYGGLARATYSTLNSTVTASGGTLTLAKMATLHSAIMSGSVKPTLGLCDETVWDLYEQLLQPQERINKEVSVTPKIDMGAGTGFTSLFYRGFPIIADEKATSQTLFFLNEKFLEFRALPVDMTDPVNFSVTDIEGNDYTNVKGLGFSWSGWIKPSNQASITGHIYFGGQFWSSNPKRHGKLTGVTGV